MKQLSRFLNSFGFILYGIVLVFLIFTKKPWYSIVILNIINAFALFLIIWKDNNPLSHWCLEVHTLNNSVACISSFTILVFLFDLSGGLYTVLLDYSTLNNDIFSCFFLVFHPAILFGGVALLDEFFLIK